MTSDSYSHFKPLRAFSTFVLLECLSSSLVFAPGVAADHSGGARDAIDVWYFG